MIYIGLISYPLYLWHWPILSYARLLHFKEPTDLVKGLCIVLAFVLAHLTYRYIERPIRFGTPTLRKPIMASAALTAAGCLGLLIYAGSGIPSRFPKELQNVVADFRNNAAEDARQYRCLDKGRGQMSFAAVCDGMDQPGTRRVLLWGDSHSAHLGPGLEELSKKEKFKLTQYASADARRSANFPATTTRLARISTNSFCARSPNSSPMSSSWPGDGISMTANCTLVMFRRKTFRPPSRM